MHWMPHDIVLTYSNPFKWVEGVIVEVEEKRNAEMRSKLFGWAAIFKFGIDMLKQIKWLFDYQLKNLLFFLWLFLQCIVLEFLSQPDCGRLMLSLSSSGALVPSLLLPFNTGKNKAVYFLKRENVAITVDNVAAMLVYGDLSPNALDQMAILLDQVRFFGIF